MGKKDAMNRGSQIDKYRKRIGKHDVRKNKTLTKSIKDTANTRKSAVGITEVFLICAAIFIGLAAVNLFAYMYFSH